MSTYIETLKKGSDSILPRTRTEAVTNANGTNVDVLVGQADHRNLLDNPFFTVNQRGDTTYSVGAYGVDRWKLISGTATVANNQITLNGTLRQIRETSLGTNDYTCSVDCASGTATVSYDDSTKYFDIVSSGGVIKAVKLELGTESTLAYDVEPDYASELLKCQRYFVRFGATKTWSRFAQGFINSSTSARIFVTIPKMRTVPTFVTSGNFKIWTSGGTEYFISQISFDSNSSTLETALLICTISGGTANRPCEFATNDDSSASLSFSADL